jgi:hypothetical protein
VPKHAAHGAVRTVAASLQELALDAAISPRGFSRAKANDHLTALGALTRSAARWPSSVERPLAADQLSVPAQQGFRG